MRRYLSRLIERVRCQHRWRYSRTMSQAQPFGTAMEVCRDCGAVRRMPRGPRFDLPRRNP